MFISSSCSNYPGRNLGFRLSHEAPASNNFIRPNWVIERDVKYGDGAEQLADLYLASNRKRNPAIIFIHGGGWISGDKSAYLGRAKKYALAGFNVIAINYTLARQDDETTRWPKQLEDVQTAVRWVRKNAALFGIDPDRIAAGGDSAGGHLALFLGALDEAFSGTNPTLYSEYPSKVSVVLNEFGPSNLAAPNLMGAISNLPLISEKTIESLAKASPINYISTNMSPVCTIHGTSDQVIPYDQSVALHEKLNYYHVPNKLATFEGGHEIAELPKWRKGALDMIGLHFVLKHIRLKER